MLPFVELDLNQVAEPPPRLESRRRTTNVGASAWSDDDDDDYMSRRPDVASSQTRNPTPRVPSASTRRRPDDVGAALLQRSRDLEAKINETHQRLRAVEESTAVAIGAGRKGEASAQDVDVRSRSAKKIVADIGAAHETVDKLREAIATLGKQPDVGGKFDIPDIGTNHTTGNKDGKKNAEIMKVTHEESADISESHAKDHAKHHTTHTDKAESATPSKAEDKMKHYEMNPYWNVGNWPPNTGKNMHFYKSMIPIMRGKLYENSECSCVDEKEGMFESIKQYKLQWFKDKDVYDGFKSVVCESSMEAPHFPKVGFTATTLFNPKDTEKERDSITIASLTMPSELKGNLSAWYKKYIPSANSDFLDMIFDKQSCLDLLCGSFNIYSQDTTLLKKGFQRDYRSNMELTSEALYRKTNYLPKDVLQVLTYGDTEIQYLKQTYTLPGSRSDITVANISWENYQNKVFSEVFNDLFLRLAEQKCDVIAVQGGKYNENDSKFGGFERKGQVDCGTYANSLYLRSESDWTTVDEVKKTHMEEQLEAKRQVQAEYQRKKVEEIQTSLKDAKANLEKESLDVQNEENEKAEARVLVEKLTQELESATKLLSSYTK